MIRFILRSLITLTFLAAITWLISQWKLQQDMERLQSSLRPIVEMRYDGVSANLLGKLSIRNLTLREHNSGITLDMRRLTVDAGNLWQLLTLRNALKDVRLPQELRITFDEVIVPFSDVAQFLSVDRDPNAFEILQAAACGPIKQITPKEIVAMGYSYFELSGSLNYEYQERTGRILLSGVLDIDDFERQQFSIEIGGIAAWLEAQDKHSSEAILPRLDRYTQSIIDQGYNRRKAEYCAIKSERSVETYLARHPEVVAEALEKVGLHFSEQGMEAYRELVKPGARLDIELEPRSNFELDNIVYYNMDEWTRIAGLSISVNGQKVTAPIPDWDFAKFEKIAESRRAERLRQQVEERRQYESKVIKRQFVPVELTRIDALVGARVRLLRSDDTLYEGEILKTDADRVWLTLKNLSGEATISIRKNELRAAYVYR